MKREPFSRRNFIGQTGKATLAIGLPASVLPTVISCNTPKILASNASPTPYTQQPLPYSYSALARSIDALTMEIHYTKHAAAYSKNLAEATAAENVNTGNTSLESLLSNITKYSAKMRNNAGGHYNHELFWKVMTPKENEKPEGALMNALQKSFGSYEAFTTQFSDAGKSRFGSGWAWLVLTNDKQLKISSTPNQDNPLMDVRSCLKLVRIDI
jgi:Fe-Mn family superoxide dismutase